MTFEAGDSAVLRQLPQGSIVSVRGWPEVGRAVAVEVSGRWIEATYPCTTPFVRPMRFG